MTPTTPPGKRPGAARIAELEARLAEAEETLRAIRAGEVDAIVVQGAEGERVFTLTGAERPYRELVEAMSEGAATLGHDGTILYCNRRLADMLGLPLEQVMGTVLRDHVAPDSAATFDALLRAGRERSSKGEIALRSARGALVPTYLSTTAVGDVEPVLAVVATDLTEQVQAQEMVTAEKLARSVLEQAAEAIVVCDAAGTITRASRAAHALSGQDPLLQPFHRMFPIVVKGPEGAPAPVDVLAAALGGEVVRGREATLVRDGTRFELQLSAGPLSSADGSVIGCVVTFTDVTELREAVAIRDRFLSIASHELKTPITTLSIVAESLIRSLETVTREVLTRRLTALSRQTARLNRLVNDLLDVSRIRGGLLQLSIEPVDLGALVREIVDRHSEEAARAGCAVTVRAAGPVVGAWDRARLDQVVTNLLGNALKYGVGKPVSIVVESKGKTARLSIEDRGIGIAPKDHQRIFRQFERAVGDGEFGGMGLGLWISHEIVARLGGSLHVESRVGEGARFVIELPLELAGG